MNSSLKGSKGTAILKIALSFFCFLLIWSAYVITSNRYGKIHFIQDLLSLGDCIWIVSGAFLVWKNRSALHIRPLTMFTSIPQARFWLIPAALIAAYYLAAMIYTYGGVMPRPEEPVLWLIIMFSLVAFQEELLFRGYFFNHLASCMPEPKANLLSALFFLLIHFPGWIDHGTSATAILNTSLGIYFLGLFFGWSFRKSRSLWVPIFLHLLWDVGSRIVF